MNFCPTVTVSPANRKMGPVVSQHSHINRKIRGYLRPWWSQYNLQHAIKGISSSNLTSNFNPKIFLQVNCLVHDSFLSDLHTKRSPTQSDIYQMLYWYNWFSWWWARGCSIHVENWNKYIEKNCASSWSFTKNHNKMHGQQNIKCLVHINITCLHCYGVSSLFSLWFTFPYIWIMIQFQTT
jgi:hypothetical protein